MNFYSPSDTQHPRKELTRWKEELKSHVETSIAIISLSSVLDTVVGKLEIGIGCPGL